MGDEPRAFFSDPAHHLGRRIGAVPNHYRLGLRGNGMTVWDIEDEAVDRLGAAIAAVLESISSEPATHCVGRLAPRPRVFMAGNIPAQPPAATNSASCTALSAAPLRMLSATTHRLRPRGCEKSSRMRPTNTGSLPEAWVTGVG